MIRQSLAIAKKEVILDLRFKWNFFFSYMLMPVKWFLLFILIYFGFYTFGAGNLGWVSIDNYLTFLLFGTLFHFIVITSLRVYAQKFKQEKFWQTIQGILIAPLGNFSLVIGIALSGLLYLFFILLFTFIAAYIINQVSIGIFLFTLVVVLISYLSLQGIGLIYASFTLTNENFMFLFVYLELLITTLSCFYYPIDVIPRALRPIIYLNPVYHANLIVKKLWITGTYNIWSFIFLIIFAILSLILGMIIFKRMLRKLGVRGY